MSRFIDRTAQRFSHLLDVDKSTGDICAEFDGDILSDDPRNFRLVQSDFVKSYQNQSPNRPANVMSLRASSRTSATMI